MTGLHAFINAKICLRGKFMDEGTPLFVDGDTGRIVDGLSSTTPDEVHDLKGYILAPAFLELQTNGCTGVHFTVFEDENTYHENLRKISKYLVTTGVGAFWATIPTVSSHVFGKVLPQLSPQAFTGGACLLGAHCEGPFISANKRGAHDASLMKIPGHTSAESIYGSTANMRHTKMVTVAPELEGSSQLIDNLVKNHNIKVSLGHSAADYDAGVAGLKSGATMLTHVFNAMNPLNHRMPGLAGLIASPDAPFFSLIPDGIHLHPATLTMAFRANPQKCILITDSVEMAGMLDGVYPGHAQIPHDQKKEGNKVTINGTDTLIGSCISIDECVRNLWRWSGCYLPEAIRCVTENIADMMDLKDRGILEPGRRADFVVLDETGHVIETWLQGEMAYKSRAVEWSEINEF